MPPLLIPNALPRAANPECLGRFFLLFFDLFLEFSSCDGLSAREFCRDVRAGEGRDGFAHVRVGHGVDVFEEGN